MSSNTNPLSGDTLTPATRTAITTSNTNIILDSDANQSSFLVTNNSTKSFYIDKYANVSINHTSPVAQLDINSSNGSCLLMRYNNTSNLATQYLNSSGVLSITASGGEINTTSNLNIKSHNGSSTGLMLNDTLVTASAAELNYLDITAAGTAYASKALVVDANKDITGIRYLTATQLTGTLQTAAQTNITSVGTLSSLAITTSNPHALVITNTTSTSIADIQFVASNATWEVGARGADNLPGNCFYIHKAGMRFVIDANGKCGMGGNISPSYELDVTGDINISGSYRVSGNIVNLSALTATAGTLTASKAIIVDSNKKINELLVEHTDGVGIIQSCATTNQTNYISLASDTKTYNVGSTGSTTTYNPNSFTVYDATANKYRFTIDTSGNVGIGLDTTVPSYKLDVSGDINITGSYRVNGTVADLSALAATPGTASASKALIVDSNKDITGIRYLTATQLTGTLQTAAQTNITSVGTLTGLGLNGNITLTGDNTTCSSTITITGGGAPTTTTGMSIRYITGTSTGIINSYNYSSPAQGNMNMNNGTIYLKSDKTVGINNTSPAYTLDVTGTVYASVKMRTPYIQVGNSTDTTRAISALTGGDAMITLGASNNDRNQAEILYKHIGTSDPTNRLSFGFYGSSYNSILNILAGKKVGINKTDPGYDLDVTGDISLSGSLRNGSTVYINSSGLVQVAGQTNITSVGTLTGLTISGATSITNTTDSSAYTNGSLVISGGVGIAKNVYINGGINVANTSSFSGTVTAPTQSYDDNTTKLATTAFVYNAIHTQNSISFFPTGFENTTDSTITYNPTTRILTVSPVSSSFNVWVEGKRYTYSSPISTSAHADTTGGVYYVFIDNTGTISMSSTFPSYYSKAMVSFIYYYDDTHYIFAEERHGTVMDPATHVELHHNIGTYYISGLVLADYSLSLSTPTDLGNQFSVSTGVISDEGLNSTITALVSGGPYTVMYMTTSNAYWTWTTNNTVPFYYTTSSYINYNQNNAGTWQLTNVNTSNRYVNYYVCFAPSLTTETQILIIPGQSIFTSLTLAQAENFYNLSLATLPFPEFLPLYQLSFRTNNAYNNLGKCRLEGINRIVGTKVSIVNNVATNHQSLSGLQIAGTGSTYGHITDTTQTIAGDKTLSDTTDSTTTTSGALVVSGGVGIAKNLYVGTGIYGTISTASQTSITSVGTLTGLTVSGATSITNNTASTSSSTGALVITGGLGVGGDVYGATSFNSQRVFMKAATNTYGLSHKSSDDSVELVTNVSGTDASIGTYTNHKFCILSNNACVGNWSSTGLRVGDSTIASYKLDVSGDINTSGTYKIAGTTVIDSSKNISNIGTISASGIVSLTNTTASTSISDGALVVSGGVGITKNLYVGTGIYGTLQTAAQTNITSVGTLTGLTVSGITTISNTTASTSISDGALVVSGGVGITKNLYVGTGIYGTLQTAAQTNITSVGALNGVVLTPSSISVSTYTITNGLWSSGTDRYWGMRQSDASTLVLGCAGGGTWNDKFFFTHLNSFFSIGERTPKVKFDMGTYTNDYLIALSNATVAGSDYYGFGANSSSLYYYTITDHKFYYGSKDNAKGTLALTVSSAGVDAIGYKLNGTAYDISLLSATAGTVTASKAVIVDSNKDISGFRTLKSDTIVVNTNASTTNTDSGVIVNRYQIANEAGTGDIVSDTATYTTTVTSTTTATIVLAAGASAVDNYYTNWWIKITSGNANNNVRKVTGYVGSTKTLTLATSLSVATTAGDTISLYSKSYPALIWNETNNQFIVAYTPTYPSTSYTIIDKAEFVANDIIVSSTTDATSSSSGGGITIAGGAAIAKKLYVGTTAYAQTFDASTGFKVNGTSYDISLLSATAGTVTASKAVVVDGSKNAYGFAGVKLDTLTSNTGGTAINITNDATSWSILCYDTTNNIKTGIKTNGVIGTYTNHSLKFVTNDTQRAIIDTSGNMAIGRSSPTYKLDVYGDVRIGTDDNTTENRLLFAGTNMDSGPFKAVISERIYQTSTEKSELLLFKGNDVDSTNGPDRIRIRGANVVLQTYNVLEDYTGLLDNGTALSIDTSGVISLPITTDATSYSDGALIISGGVGIAKKLYVNAGIYGTLQTAAQTNITSVGTLTSQLSVKRSVNTDYAYMVLNNSGNQTVFATSEGIGRYDTAQLKLFCNNSQVGSLTSTGLRLGDTTSASYKLDIIGDISSNGSWRNGSTILMNSSGVLQVASQTNITSVGTLTGLTVNGNASFGSVSSPVWPIHITSAAANKMFCINGTTTGATDWCGFGSNSSGDVLYQCKRYHAFYTGSLGNSLGTPSVLMTATAVYMPSLAIGENITITSSREVTVNKYITLGGIISYITTDAEQSDSTIQIPTTTMTNTSATGTDSILRALCHIKAPTFVNTNAITTTTACTMYISGDPSAGTNSVLTNSYALYVNGKINATSYYKNGTAYDISLLSATAGTVTASKAVVVDSNKDITGFRYVYATKVLVGGSTDTSRMVSILDSGLTNGDVRYLTLGKANSSNNQAELGYRHVGDGNTKNALEFGHHGGPTVYIRFNGTNGFGVSQPQFQIHSTNAVRRSWALFSNMNDTTTGQDFYGFGAASSTVYFSTKTGFEFNTSVTDSADGNLAVAINTSYMRCYAYSSVSLLASDTYGYFLNTSHGNSSIGPTSFDTSIYSNKSVFVESGGFYTKSDRRYKTDINYYSNIDNDRIIHGIDNINLASFKYKNSSNFQSGLIAQEAIKAGLGELITASADEGLKATDEFDIENVCLGIDYGKIGLLLIPYVKNLKQTNINLEAKVVELETKKIESDNKIQQLELQNEQLQTTLNDILLRLQNLESQK